METIKEDYVDYELAVMLKEIGFNCETHRYYNDLYENHNRYYASDVWNHNAYGKEISCPTLYLAQKWLRKEKNIMVEVWCNASGYNCDVTKTDGTFIQDFENCDSSNDGGMFDKYEDALINALKWTCRYLLKLKKDNE